MEENTQQKQGLFGYVMTDEDRQRIQEQRIKDQEWAKENLKTEWMDENFLRSLASERGFTLAPWWKPTTDIKYINRALKAIGKDSSWHLESFGFRPTKWKDMNPKTPAWVAQCLIFEMDKF